MSRRLLFLVHFGFLAFAADNALATSKAVRGHGMSDPQSAAPYCRVEATFVRETHVLESYVFNGKPTERTRVSWVFDISSAQSIRGGQCPAGARFQLAIRDAEFVSDDSAGSGGKYVYGVDMRVPASNARVTMHVRYLEGTDALTRNRYQEWLVTDWENGFRQD